MEGLTDELHYLRVCSLLVDRVFSLDLVEGASGVKENLPDVVHVSLPLVEAAAKVELVCQGVHRWVEDRVVKHETLEQDWISETMPGYSKTANTVKSYRTVAIWIIIWYEHLEPEDTILEETLPHEDDSVPTCNTIVGIKAKNETTLLQGVP